MYATIRSQQIRQKFQKYYNNLKILKLWHILITALALTVPLRLLVVMKSLDN